MTVELTENAIMLKGNCGVEDVEPVLALLDGHPGLPIELGAAGHIHTALWQALLMAGPLLRGDPADPFSEHILKAFRRSAH